MPKHAPQQSCEKYSLPPIDVYMTCLQHEGMATRLELQRNSALAPELAAADLDTLQLECAEIAAYGGEALQRDIDKVERELYGLQSRRQK